MYVDDTRSRAIVFPPRTGSRSIEKLCRHYGWRQIGGRHHVEPGEMAGNTVYCTIRNPWEVLVSWFTYPSLQNPVGEKRLLEWMKGKPDCLRQWVDPGAMFGRWSQYADHALDLANMASNSRLLFGEHVSVPHVREDRDVPHYSTFYTDDEAAAVGEMFADEIERYGFVFSRV